MSETIAAPAPAAASSPAPASAPASSAPAPVAAPAPVSTPATPSSPAPQTWGTGGVTTTVDPNKFPIKEDFAREVLKEKMAAIPAVEEAPAPAEEVAPAVEPAAEPEAAPEVAAPDAEPKVEEPAAAEPDFELEPEGIVTPEALTQMVKDNPELGKLLELDPRLKGQLYKTTREAAEVQAYKAILPDVESAKEAVGLATTFNDVKSVFMGSTTKEGTIAALGKIAELSYERDANGNVVMENGQPVIGEDFFSFVDNTVRIDLEHRRDEVKERLDANQYHIGAKTQEEAQAAYDHDANRIAFFDDMLGEVVEAPAIDQLPPELQRKAAELDRREKEINQRQHGEKVEERRTFESGLQKEAETRINDGIGKIIANVEKQGGVISPYLKNILPKAIGSKLIAKIQGNPALKANMDALQRLPMSPEARTRRIAAIDRAVQDYLPEVAREELREAGVQIANASAAKRAKVDAQIAATKKTEIAGSHGVPGGGSAPMTSSAAFDHAQAEWQKTNPGRPFDKVARESILPRVLQLMTASSR